MKKNTELYKRIQEKQNDLRTYYDEMKKRFGILKRYKNLVEASPLIFEDLSQFEASLWNFNICTTNLESLFEILNDKPTEILNTDLLNFVERKTDELVYYIVIGTTEQQHGSKKKQQKKLNL